MPKIDKDPSDKAVESKKKENESVNTIAELINADLDDVAAGHSSDHHSIPQ